MDPALHALWTEGQRETRRKHWHAAIASYRKAVALEPGFVPAWLELSTALEAVDSYRESRHALLCAARAGGPNVDPMIGMTIARRLRRFEEGELLQRYIEAASLPSRVSAERLVDLAMLVSSIGAYGPAMKWLDDALRRRPGLSSAFHMRGLLHMFRGERDDARRELERALALDAAYAPTYSILARVRKARPGDNAVDLLKDLLRKASNPRDQVHLGYALHQELHDLGEHAEAWNALALACRHQRQLQPYDHAATVRMFEVQRRLFSGRSVPGELETPALTPIFIVGMHRSGTTLLERILSGHPDVADAGETYTFTAQLRIATDHFCKGAADLTLLERSGSVDYSILGKQYLDALQWRAGDRHRITEKLNPNFILCGQIATALPGARLLHIARAPIDTCFSNLRTLFTTEARYSYDQVELADYYKAYHDLMGFWREVLGHRLVDVRYEALVEDPEAQARRVAASCGLDYTEAMLDVSRAGGMVATASSNQVRGGVLKDRGDAWKPYATQLAPLLDRLAAHGLI